MLEYVTIDISKGINVNKTSALKECDICHYWYFKDIGFKYEPYLCNGCHDLMQETMSFIDVAIFYVKGNEYRIHFWYMSKDDAISIMTNSNLVDKKGALYFLYFMKNLGECNSIECKPVELTYYQRNRNVILNRAKDYYENDKERLRRQARDEYRNLSEEEKNKKREYRKNRYHNMPEEKKILKECQKIIARLKSLNIIINKMVF